MNRLIGVLFCGLLLGSLGWSQSVWRGQAEVWTGPDAPSEGFVAASNEFPRNSLLKVENFKSQKSIDVRVVSGLPDGSTALVLLNAKAAAALDIKSGEVPMVGVSPDTSSSDLSQNPDPDINPAVDAPAAVAMTPPPAATAVPPSSDSSPDAASEPSAEGSAPTPLPVVPETTPTPSTPGKTVFESTDQPAPPAPAPVAEPAAAPDSEAPAPATTETPVPETAETPAPATTVAPAVPLPPTGSTPEAPPVVTAPAPETPPVTAPLSPPSSPPLTPLAVAPTVLPSDRAWVSEPQPLKGPVLGQVVWIPALDHGKAYVQVGAWPTRAALVATLDTVKSYVPLVLFNAKGEKNPWRLLASAPHSQLGVLLNSYRAQGFGRATVVKG